MTTFKEFRRLGPFEECAGPLKEVNEQGGVLVALIGEIHLSLPLDTEHSLLPFIGQRITILHTDIPGKQYVFRAIVKEDAKDVE